jgi:hypothetical protein
MLAKLGIIGFSAKNIHTQYCLQIVGKIVTYFRHEKKVLIIRAIESEE